MRYTLEIYGSDWALVLENDKRVYFVAEIKATEERKELRLSEDMKIKCGRKHFDQLSEVEFRAPVSSVSEIVNRSYYNLIKYWVFVYLILLSY